MESASGRCMFRGRIWPTVSSLSAEDVPVHEDLIEGCVIPYQFADVHPQSRNTRNPRENI